jgi:hypothetical protein|nr:outer membrane beta-barrel protein [Kofleriaceae bacterium]
MTRRYLVLALFASRLAAAQPVTSPTAPPAAPTQPAAPAGPPLAQVRDDKQLAEALAQITNDPSVYVDNPKVRPLAQALMTEGIHLVQQHSYDQALANFLEAYAKLPSPRILLDIASTLYEMGRYADAANTYQRFLGDPSATADRMTEVKQLLDELDHQLTILTVRVVPHGSDISIDGGPFVTVGSTLLTRVRPGIHLVRIRNSGNADEVSINGFVAESKEVYTAVKMAVTPDQTGSGSGSGSGSATVVAYGSAAGSDAGSGSDAAAKPTEAWLAVGTLYATADPTSRERHVKSSSTTQATVVSAIVPPYDLTDDGLVVVNPQPEHTVSSGALAMLRIDGEGHGFAGGLGIAFAATDNFEVELAALRSNEWGAYAGARYRFLTGQIRPYLGAGIPVFFFTTTDDNGVDSSHVGVGGRIAGGVELELNGHLSVEGDLGYEHFFNVSNTPFIANVFVPTVGLIGRM